MNASVCEIRPNVVLVALAQRDGEVELTFKEARQFLMEHRSQQAAREKGVEFFVQGYGGDNCEEPECQQNGCTCYVGGHDTEDIDTFLGEDGCEGTLEDYSGFQLCARA